MRETFTLGHIAGVRIGVNWSVLVIFGIIALLLAEGRLPEAYPDRSVAAYWSVGLIAAVVFFASLLAHELAHAVVARRNGVEVDSIVLWLLGGAARLNREALTPGAELRIAGVGPLVSLLVGAFFTGLTWLLVAVTDAELVIEAVAWLAAINVLLAVFNSIPAAPLDGGRLLRAFLWWRTGDRVRAASGAAAAGRAFGWLLVALGVFLAFTGPAFNGLWLVLIGWFIAAAASAEERQTQLRAVLSGVPVRQAMTPDPITAPATMPVTDLLTEPPYRYRHSAFPVTDDSGAPVGLVTLERITGVPAEERARTAVRDIMVPLAEVRTAGPEDSLADLLPQDRPDLERPTLVIDDGGLAGLLSPSDVSRTATWLITSRARQGRGPGQDLGPGGGPWKTPAAGR